jgi:hypothetical protein
MSADTIKFAAVALCAMVLIPSGAHLLELASKMQLSRERYLVVQELYRGWALSGFLIVAALLSTLWLTLRLRGQPGFMAALIAFACLIATQAVFWSTTYPVNVATQNWTRAPEHWQALRARWEYSHAASAVLNIAALFASLKAVLASSH